jgi:uncharacterized protein involved in outer membrane biogenesis
MAPPHKHRWRRVAGVLLVALIAVIGLCEAMGWPFLAGPAQRWLAGTLERDVRLSADPQASQAVKMRFLGGIRLQADHLEIGAPAWSSAPHMVRTRGAFLALRYQDLWRARQGEPLRIHVLRADVLDAHLERLADGRASWQFKRNETFQDGAAEPASVPSFGLLQVASGVLRYSDAPLALELDARVSLTDGQAQPDRGETMPAPGSGPGDRSAPPEAARQPGNVLQVHATGRYQKQPLRVELRSSGVLPWVDKDAATPVPISLDATVGQAKLVFNGTAMDVLSLGSLTGRFSVSGPSLAAVGDPLGVTLPTTASFHTEGALVKEGNLWRAAIASAKVGSSQLSGAFTYDANRSVPLLSGQLVGKKLMLADLGPAVGVPAGEARPVPVPPAAADASAQSRGKVLPDRPFDLPSLRTMDANVLINVDDVELGSDVLEPLRPLRGHLQLSGGVLTFRNLHAQTGQGRLAGLVRLDGRGDRALWHADLRWDGVRLERWIRQPRGGDAPPYVAGRLAGQATLTGRGRSTAEILGGLQGKLRTQLHEGSVSHLAIEAVGLDLAQSLGVLIKGDQSLRIHCALADLTAGEGVLRPKVMVIDTTDSTVWVDGTVSLGTEELDLRTVVTPKDFSPLSLRTPVRIGGSFAQPDVSLEKEPLAQKVAAAVLLALANPLAALVPLIDPGSPEAAPQGAGGCADLVQRSRARQAAMAQQQR